MAAARVVLKLLGTSCLAAGLLIFPARLSSADPITVTFTVFPDPDDRINSGPSTGSFTFDSSLVPDRPLEVVDDDGELADAISFAWASTLWTEDNADVVWLRFDAEGRLRDFRMGGGPNTATAIFHIPIDDFWMNALVMDYTLLGQPGEHFFNARVALADAAPVPEPGTLLLMGTGALVLMRRRQLSSRYR